MKPRIVHVGLGPLGLAIARDLALRGRGELVAAVDRHPDLAGRALSELVPGSAPGVRVLESVEGLDAGGLDAAVVTTVSDLERCAPTLRALLARGIPTVSTCEELLWPWLRHPALAEELDAAARAGGGGLLGTGVNPGFLMDALPLFVSSAALEVRGARIERVQDASTRRLPFQRKIGAGLSLEAFEARRRDGSLRHVGLGESLHFVAGCMGFDVERWEETLEPVVAERDLACDLGPIPAGAARGVRQLARGWVADEPRFELEFVAAIGEPDPRDRVLLDSDPPIDVVVQGGLHGDLATSAVVQNCLAPLIEAGPGLHTMADLRSPHWVRPGGVRAGT